MSKVLIKNISKIVSGDIKKGILEGDTVLIENGLISGIGSESQLDTKGVEKVVDANGSVVIPGLIDSHVHIWLEDYHPVFGMTRWMEVNLSVGVTTLIEAEVMRMGLVREPSYLKCLAILTHKKWKAYKPGGYLKVEAGAIIYDDGFTERDFKQMAGEGIHLVAEIGCTADPFSEKVMQMVEWSKKYGMIVSLHFGGISTPLASSVTFDVAKKIKPDKIAHINGGPIANSLEECKKVVTELDSAIEISWNGNPKVMYNIVEFIKEKEQLHRVILGSDSPTGLGYSPFAIHQLIYNISSLHGIPAETAIAMATGTTADAHRLNRGKIEKGREADILIIDAPPGSVGTDALSTIEAGDQPAISMVMVDGHIIGVWGRATRKPIRPIKIDGIEQPTHKVTFEEYILGPNAYFPEF